VTVFASKRLLPRAHLFTKLRSNSPSPPLNVEHVRRRCPVGSERIPLDPKTVRTNEMSPAASFRCSQVNKCNAGFCKNVGICINKANGKIECIPKVNLCNEAGKWGGCFVSTDLKGPDGQTLSACENQVPSLLAIAGNNTLPDERQEKALWQAPASKCNCALLPCHEGDGRTCKAKCPQKDCMHAEMPAISMCVIKRGNGASHR
jgi:hypothetical protein